jgi:non-specific serine/threonine protein kinase
VEGSGWLEQVLALGGEPGLSAVLVRARAGALNGAANLAQARGEYPRSVVFLEESLALSRRLGDPAGEAAALHNLGLAARMLGDREWARTCLNESLSRFRALAEPRNAGLALLNLGRLSHDEGDLERATTLFSESLALLRMAGSAQGTATVLNRLGELARDRRDLAAAVRRHEVALTIHRERADPWGVGLSLLCLARVASVRPDHTQALVLASQSLRAMVGVGADRDTAAALVVMATSLCATGQAGIGTELLSAVARAFPEESLIAAERVSFEEAVASATAALSKAAYESAWASARHHTLDQAVERALGMAEPAAPEPSGATLGAAPSASLTRREREVAALIARGLTNRDIADRLVISELTADSHVSHILRKLSFRSRAQVAAWATQHGLATPEPD